MFDSLSKYLDELEGSADSTQKFLRKLSGGVTRLANSIIKAEESIKGVRNETKYVAQLKRELAIEGRNAAKDILYANAIEAIRENYEFDDPLYRRALFQAIQDDDTYLVRTRGSGFKSTITIDIDLNRTGGRLTMWGAAVKAAREELGTKYDPKARGKNRKLSAAQASRAWAGIFSSRTSDPKKRFKTTVRLRLSYSPKIASFWELIDKGDVSLASDRGGYSTPKKKPTNFAHRSEESSNRYIQNVFNEEKKKYDILTSSYDKVLAEANLALDQLAALLGEIRLDSKQIGTLDRRAEKVLKANYSTKLEKAVQLIRDGLLATRRVELAARGSYRGRKFSSETLRDLLE